MITRNGVKIIASNEDYQDLFKKDEYFIVDTIRPEYVLSELYQFKNNKAVYVGLIRNIDKTIEIAKLLNQDNSGQDNTFSMFNEWKPDIKVSESVLKEFIFFWTGKPNIKKTLDDWHKALLRSQQYADSRDEYYRSKEGGNHG